MDVIVSFYALRPIRWDREPYQKATLAEKRVAAMFMALCPVASLDFFSNTERFGRWVDSMIYGRHAMIWFYLVIFGVVFITVVIQYKIAL